MIYPRTDGTRGSTQKTCGQPAGSETWQSPEFHESAAAPDLRGSDAAGAHALADQLNRATVSIPLNVAEGAGEFAGREKARFYRIARRSATECAAILDVAARLDLVSQEQIESGKEQLRAIVAILIVLGKRKELE